jgi:hypothetical protein
MCSINHDKKCIFIHIPKNGGSYIAEILSKYYGFKNYYLQRPDHKNFCLGKDYSVDKHENKIHGTLVYYKTSPFINNIMNMNNEKWNSYFIFTFIRNPYSRIVSGWNYVNKHNISFKNYLDINYKASSYNYWHVFMSQTRHIIDINGKININYIGKLENLENDLKIILNKINITNIIHKPFKKNSREHNDYKTYYNNNILNKVNILMKEDFENLDYEKIEDLNFFITYNI